MSLKMLVQEDIKNAMRAGDSRLRDVLRLISAAVKQIEVDERTEVNDQRMLVVLEKMSKQRLESIALFNAAGRDDLVEKEEYEHEVIHRYLPEPLSESDVIKLVEFELLASKATSMRDMGKVMTALKPKLQGRADMSHVSAMLKAALDV